MHPALGGGPAAPRARGGGPRATRPAGVRRGHRPGRSAWPRLAPGGGTGVSRRNEPRPVRVEFVTVDGTEGQALEERQLAVIKEILTWLHEHPDSVGHPNDQQQDDRKAA